MSAKDNRAVAVGESARRFIRIAALSATFVSLSLPAWSQQKSADLTERSLEDLMDIKVTSVSKTEEPLSRTAAAVFIISRENIAHSGATNIPDLLRMVPGLDVAQIDGNTWAISARGLNGRFAAREEFLFRATHDELTGLVNRRVVIEAIAREHSRHIREGASFSIIMLDLDHFKNINDTYGHLAGDAVLKEVAHRVAGCLRPYDTVGRYGARNS